MKRKRFIKHLMGKGLPRNKAIDFAAFLRERGVPYKFCTHIKITRLETGKHHIDCLVPWEYQHNLLPQIPLFGCENSHEKEQGGFICSPHAFTGEFFSSNSERIKASWAKLPNASLWWLRTPYQSMSAFPFAYLTEGRIPPAPNGFMNWCSLTPKGFIS